MMEIYIRYYRWVCPYLPPIYDNKNDQKRYRQFEKNVNNLTANKFKNQTFKNRVKGARKIYFSCGK